MSEPVKSAEIEDVLSSIRRLVSEDYRQTAARPEETPARPIERFVLTDALRVTDPEDHAEEPSDAETATLEPLVLETQEIVAKDELGDEIGADDTEFRDGEPDQDEVDDYLTEVAQDDSASADEEPAFVIDIQSEEDPAETAVLDALADRQSEHSEAPWSDPSTTLHEAAELAGDGLWEAPDAADDDMRPLGEKIAALEEVIGRTDDQWEPDGAGVDDYAGTVVAALDWENADDSADTDSEDVDPISAAAAETDVLVDAEVSEDNAPPEDDAPAEATLDEDALRALVADIVREELQGPLGERITRNVRKLVRREIQRALAVKDLD